MTKSNPEQTDTHPNDAKEPNKPRTPKWMGLQGRTVWDLIQLLVVPLVLAGIGFYFTDQQRMRDLEIENARQAAQLNIEENRTKDSILQSYLDDMTTLMLQEEFAAVERGPCPQSLRYQAPIATLARSRTLVVLKQLTGQRSGAVVKFLAEAELLGALDCDLQGADFTEADLSFVDLSMVNLSGADLREADLHEGYLHHADLSGADLSATNLSGAELVTANLRYAKLGGANLRGSAPYEADLSEADLHGADLRGAQLVRADLRGADLRGADLREANMHGAILTDAHFDENTILPDGSHWSPGWTPESTPESTPEASS